MYHFKKEIANLKVNNVIDNFNYPTTLATISDEDKVLVANVLDFPQSTSFQKFIELRKQVVKMPLNVLYEKPNLIKRYLIAGNHFMKYLKKYQEKNGIENNDLVNKLFLLDTIIDEENDKVYFTNYSLIALLIRSNAMNEEVPSHEDAKAFVDGNKDITFNFEMNGSKYKLTNTYTNVYFFGVGVRA